MNANEWINFDRTITSSKRYYAHFDQRTNMGQQKKYILSADKVAAHFQKIPLLLKLKKKLLKDISLMEIMDIAYTV